ncbi:hypothetical protein [Yinghuangia seranimata]|uniref:hypothetical protein n=1 Tax=Yinghuangia seranimata TaxID=408067 RepID=UPI00248BF862|nr:hypothetical protein [Yinghuangia seranimata]MDI2125496.1 hypothetical protein [Yinghuangia seranimata]
MNTPPPAEAPARLRIAFALEVFDDGLLAQVLVEPTRSRYLRLVDQAYESGFLLCVGDAAATSAEIHVWDGCFAALSMLGGRHTWRTGAPTPLTSGWLGAATEIGCAVVELVPPGTWPDDVDHLTPDERLEAFNDRLTAAAQAGTILHGLAPVTVEDAL